MAKFGTALQMNVIKLLVEGKSRSEIAKELGCCLKTVDDVKADKDLRQLYYQQCNDAVESLVPLAIRRLKNILENDKQQGSVHIAAVKTVLEQSHLKELLDTTDKNVNITISYE